MPSASISILRNTMYNVENRIFSFRIISHPEGKKDKEIYLGDNEIVID